MNIDTQVKKLKEAEAAAEARRNALLDSLRQEREEIDRALADLDEEPQSYSIFDDYEEEEPAKEEPAKEEPAKEEPRIEKKSGNGIIGFVAGVSLTALLIGGYVLIKENKKLKAEILDATRTSTSLVEVNPETEEEVEVKEVNYSYNYDKNIATVTTTTTETIGETTVTIIEEEKYDELTTEKFEELCTNAIKYLDELGINVKKSDVVKFVALFNIDKLKQDNPELVRDLLGTQTLEEFFADGDKVSDTIIGYDAQTAFADDNPEWQAYVESWFKGAYCPNTENLVSIADFAFDTEQQALIRSFEARRDEILKVEDLDTRSDMTKALLLDIMNAKSEYRLFDDSTLYFVLRHCIVPLDSMYNWDFLGNKSTLKTDAHKVMVEFIAPVGSTEEENQNSIMSGARRNMMDSFRLCQESAKTLTK